MNEKSLRNRCYRESSGYLRVSRWIFDERPRLNYLRSSISLFLSLSLTLFFFRLVCLSSRGWYWPDIEWMPGFMIRSRNR